MNIRPYVQIARFDHWVKNLFVVPGIVTALAMDRHRIPAFDWAATLVGLLAICLISSSNYVINEVLDAPFDRLHPRRQHRPAAAGLVNTPVAIMEWLLFFAAGMAMAASISRQFTYAAAALWVMGLAYNVPPVRLKDVAFLDVLCESINSPIRFIAGWYLTGTAALPVTSLLISYWMGGAYLMSIKRFAERRDIRSQEMLEAYRKSFRQETEQRLLVAIVFYGSISMLFFGAFMGRYRLEMALAFPLVAMVMAVYMALAFKQDGAAQNPERLLREPWLVAAVVLCAAAIGVLLFADLPWLYRIFRPTSAP